MRGSKSRKAGRAAQAPRLLTTKCNEHKVNYKSAEKYVGDDAFDLLVLFPAGIAWEVHYDISVR